jgi:hypothetical protein
MAKRVFDHLPIDPSLENGVHKHVNNCINRQSNNVHKSSSGSNLYRGSAHHYHLHGKIPFRSVPHELSEAHQSGKIIGTTLVNNGILADTSSLNIMPYFVKQFSCTSTLLRCCTHCLSDLTCSACRGLGWILCGPCEVCLSAVAAKMCSGHGLEQQETASKVVKRSIWLRCIDCDAHGAKECVSRRCTEGFMNLHVQRGVSHEMLEIASRAKAL